MSLPIASPFLPMEAKLTDQIPIGPEWQYEPKWDGFRCIAFRHGRTVELQSRLGNRSRVIFRRWRRRSRKCRRASLFWTVS